MTTITFREAAPGDEPQIEWFVRALAGQLHTRNAVTTDYVRSALRALAAAAS